MDIKEWTGLWIHFSATCKFTFYFNSTIMLTSNFLMVNSHAHSWLVQVINISTYSAGKLPCLLVQLCRFVFGCHMIWLPICIVKAGTLDVTNDLEALSLGLCPLSFDYFWKYYTKNILCSVWTGNAVVHVDRRDECSSKGYSPEL